MKNSKQLYALPVAPPPEIVAADYQEIKHCYGGSSYISRRNNYIYHADIDRSTGQDILIVTAYRPGGDPSWRVFQSQSGEYQTEMLDVNRQSGATLAYLLDYTYYSGGYITLPEYAETIRTFLKLDNNDDPIKGLAKRHRDYKEKKLKEKHDRIRQSLDDAMLEIRPLPKDVLRWVDNGPMKYSRYLFYHYAKRKQLTGYCSHCGKEVTVTGARHKQKGTCPACRSRVTYIAIGAWERTGGFTDKEEIAYYQSTKAGFCVRLYDVSRRYQPGKDRNMNGDYMPQQELHEWGRHFYEDNCDCVAAYRYRKFQEKYEYRFCSAWEERNRGFPVYIYPCNLKQFFEHDPSRKYAQIDTIARKCGKVNFHEILIEPVRKGRAMELIVKAGLYRLAAEEINRQYGASSVNWHAKKPRDILGVTMADIPILRKLDVDQEELKIYRAIKAREGKVSSADILWMREHQVGSGIIEALKYTTAHKAIKYLSMVMEDKTQIKQLKDKHWHYIYSDERIMGDILRDWEDYLKNCALLGRDMKSGFVLFPKNLNEAHDQAYKAVRVRKNELYEKAIANMEATLNQSYGYRTKSFLIRAPHDGAEIRAEGDALHHCVGGYVDEMAKGDTIILFIRKVEEPDTPYYTLELDPERLEVEQYRGFGNNVKVPVDPKVTQFIEQWKKAVIGKIKAGSRASA